MPHVHLTFQSRTRAGRGQASILIAGLVAATVLACGKERPFATGEASLQPDRESPSEAVGDASVPNPAVAADCTNVGCQQPLTCDPSLRRCVECLTSANCVSADAPLCDTATQSCVRCLTSTDCPSAAPICKLAATEREANRCVECTNDTECPDARPACDPNTNACTARCTTSAQCNPPTPVCNEQTQTCVGCLADRDCVDEAGVGRSCRPDDARCVECLSDAQCSDDPAASNCSTDGACVACAGDEDCSLIQGRSACLPSIGCVECVDATDCAGSTRGPVCKASNAGQASGTAPINTCVECTSNTDCLDTSASRCEDNQCVPCSASGDCAHVDSIPGEAVGTPLNVCDAGTCVQCTGLQSAACGASVCDNATRACSNVPAGSAGLCAPCLSDAHCSVDGSAFCARDLFGTTDLGFFCFPAAEGDDEACSQTPFSQETLTSTSDGREAPLCLLNRTTCDGMADAIRTTCEAATDCGAPSVDDGRCVTGLCSIPCTTERDCFDPTVGSCLGGACQL
jgi:hypothetical protein